MSEGTIQTRPAACPGCEQPTEAILYADSDDNYGVPTPWEIALAVCLHCWRAWCAAAEGVPDDGVYGGAEEVDEDLKLVYLNEVMWETPDRQPHPLAQRALADRGCVPKVPPPAQPYELWDADTGNVVGGYPTRAAALAVVRACVQAYGAESPAVTPLVLLCVDGPPGETSVSGAALVTLAHDPPASAYARSPEPALRTSVAQAWQTLTNEEQAP